MAFLLGPRLASATACRRSLSADTNASKGCRVSGINLDAIALVLEKRGGSVVYANRAGLPKSLAPIVSRDRNVDGANVRQELEKGATNVLGECSKDGS